MNITVTVSEHCAPQIVTTESELTAVLEAATSEARRKHVLNVIFLMAENGNTLNLAVGGDETALGFVQGNGDPPYFVSRGVATTQEPVLTCFQSLEHHTEYPRDWVVPISVGREAAFEFLTTSQLPECVEWKTV